MELSQLRTVVALAELSSISKVADALHLTPPAVFAQIRHLEGEIGAKLYERVGKRLELTVHGKRLAVRAQEIVQAHDEALAEVQELRGKSAAVLRIGCGPHSSVHILPYLLRVFLAAHPGTETRLLTGSDEFLLHGAQSGMLDAILIHLPLDKLDLEEHPLYTYKMAFVVSASAGPGRKRPTRLSDLKDVPYIRYHRIVLVDSVLEKLSCEAGFRPQTVIEGDNPAAILEMVKLGIGFAVLPAYSVAREVAARRVRIVPSTTEQAHVVGFAYRRPHHRRRTLDALIQVADQWRKWWPLAEYVSPVEPAG
jgi:DNA-binding transcriptional LysR family regulator